MARVVLALPIVGALIVAVVMLFEAQSLVLLVVVLPAVVVGGLVLFALARGRWMAPEARDGGAAPYLSLVFGNSRASDSDIHASLDAPPPAQTAPRPKRRHPRREV
jgi:hypothetical protein